jgi:tRNA (guanine-N7-)-methyltransferase
VLRQGRLTRGQQQALDRLWDAYGVDYADQAIDLDSLYGRSAERVLEIGFGNGDSLFQQAASSPDKDYLGIEVHRPGVGHLLRLANDAGLTNLRVINHDAVDVMRQQIPDRTLDCVQLFFPDPWHKKRHHKRRIVQPEFVALLARKLQHGGILHMATDWENYAQHMLEVVGASAAFRNCAGSGHYSEKPAWRPTTKFEHRGQRLGHGVWDLLFERV